MPKKPPQPEKPQPEKPAPKTKPLWQEVFAEEVFKLLAPAGVERGDVGMVYAICRTISRAENVFMQDVPLSWQDPYTPRTGEHLPRITAYSPTHGNVELGTATREARVEARTGLKRRTRSG